MLKIELVPDLSHCIEMVAKRKHVELVQKLLVPVRGNEKLQSLSLGTFQGKKANNSASWVVR